MPPLLYRLRRLERKVGDAGSDIRPQRREGSRRGRAILDRVGTYPFEIDLLFADRRFYNERVIRRARDLATTVTSVQKRGERMKDNLATHCSYMTTYHMYKGSEWELRFPLAVPVSYQDGDRRKHDEVVWGYVACDRRDRTPTQVERRSRKRSAIETSYRLFRQARAPTTTQDSLVPFAFMIVSFLLENLWLGLR